MKRFFIGLALLVLLASSFVAFKMLQPVPDDLDLRSEKLTDGGLYSVSFQKEEGAATVGPITSFLATVKDTEGKEVESAVILVDGGMPQHGHGLPTQPKQTDEVAPGIYRIDGVKFSMTGWWEFRLNINAPFGDDSATFNIVLE